MTHDTRCCGTGTCLIDAQGRCWCGQQWNGDKLCEPAATHAAPGSADTCTPTAHSPATPAVAQRSQP